MVPRLPGMNDVTAETYDRISHVVDSLTGCFHERGFERLDTPLLEETELFVRKSGGEMSSRLFSFAGPGGATVSLRPEFTSSVIRHFVQSRSSSPLSARFYYSGPVFRFDPDGEAGCSQFTQVGAELLGAGGVEADSEVILMAWEGLSRAGMRRQRLRIGHIEALNGVLDSFGLSDHTRKLVIAGMQELKSDGGSRGAQRAGPPDWPRRSGPKP